MQYNEFLTAEQAYEETSAQNMVAVSGKDELLNGVLKEVRRCISQGLYQCTKVCEQEELTKLYSVLKAMYEKGYGVFLEHYDGRYVVIISWHPDHIVEPVNMKDFDEYIKWSEYE